MNLIKVFSIGAFLLAAFSGCQKDIYDSSVQDYGQLAISIQMEGNAECDRVVVVIPDIDTVEFNGNTIIMDSIPSGTHKVIAYTISDDYIADGCLVTSLDVKEKFYAASTSCRVKSSVVNRLNLQLSERSHTILYDITYPDPLDYMTVDVFNVSSSVDLEFNRLMNPNVVNLKLEQYGDCMFGGEFMCFGVTGSEYRMLFNIYKENEIIASSELSFPMSLIGYDSSSDIRIKVNLSNDSKVAEIISQGGNWMISIGSVDINNNLNN